MVVGGFLTIGVSNTIRRVKSIALGFNRDEDDSENVTVTVRDPAAVVAGTFANIVIACADASTPSEVVIPSSRLLKVRQVSNEPAG
jgi:hypothetical protein